MMRNIALFIALLLMSGMAHAQVSINFGEGLYAQSPNLAGVGQGSGAEERMGAITSAMGIYRSEEGVFSLPIGTIIRVTYQDGSKESCEVTSLTGSMQCVVIPGTFVPAPGQATGFGSSGPGWYFWSGTVWHFGNIGEVSIHYGEVLPIIPGGGDETDEP